MLSSFQVPFGSPVISHPAFRGWHRSALLHKQAPSNVQRNTYKFLQWIFQCGGRNFDVIQIRKFCAEIFFLNKQRAAMAITQTAGVFITWTTDMQTPNSNHLDMCRLNDVIFAVLLEYVHNSALVRSVVAQATWCLETNQLYPSRIICRPIRAHTQTHIRNIDRERQRIFILRSLQEACNESIISHLLLSFCTSGFTWHFALLSQHSLLGVLHFSAMVSDGRLFTDNLNLHFSQTAHNATN